MAAHGAPASVRYEGYGPGGVAVLIDCLTPDPDRTVAVLRRAFATHGGHLGAEGAVRYLFNAAGVIVLPPGVNVPAAMDAAYAAGAEDVIAKEDGTLEVITDPAEIEMIGGRLRAAGFEPGGAAVTQRAASAVPLKGECALQAARLIATLEGLDDVQRVYSNASIPDEILARVSA